MARSCITSPMTSILTEGIAALAVIFNHDNKQKQQRSQQRNLIQATPSLYGNWFLVTNKGIVDEVRLPVAPCGSSEKNC